MLTIENDGPDITASNYWKIEIAEYGFFFLSVNAGTFRLLVPATRRSAISDMAKGAKHAVIAMLPSDKWRSHAYCCEIVVVDGTACPWSCHLSPGQIDRALPAADVGKDGLRFTVWDITPGGPAKCLDLPAKFRVVEKIEIGDVEDTF